MKQAAEVPRSHTTTPAQRALVVTLQKLLKPVARLFISQRVPFQVFVNVAKRVFVGEAYEHFHPENRTQTKSRVALITGLTRQDVNQVLIDRINLPKLLEEHRLRAYDVLEAWHLDPMFQSDDGSPLPLPMRGDDVTFGTLVRNYGADVPPRTMLEELESAGLVKYDGQGRVVPLQRHYLPKSGAAPELIQCMGTSAYWLNSTITRNILHEQEDSNERLFQRQVFSDALPPERLAEVRCQIREMLTRYYEECGEYLDSVEERPRIDEFHATAGVGIYYFEE